MAQINIGSWEIAKLFGLISCGLSDEADADGYFYYVFDLQGTPIHVRDGYGDDDAVDENEAKEEAAKRVLWAVGKLISL